MSGGIVEQGYASLLLPRTRCGEDTGPAWRTAGVSRWLWWAHPGE